MPHDSLKENLIATAAYVVSFIGKMALDPLGLGMSPASRIVAFVFLLGFPILSAEVILTEFLTRNETSVQDEDGDFSDWIEITNAGTEAVDLAEWSLTDNENRLRKWQFPAPATLGPGERRLIFATGKDRRDSLDEWHTNFRLSAPGEYLALIQPDGEIAAAYRAAPQFDDISYGQDASGHQGYLATATPGESNSDLSLPGPVISEASHAPTAPVVLEDITITVKVEGRGDAALNEVLLKSRVDYKTETSSAMLDDGTNGDVVAGDGIYTAILSARTLFGPRIPLGSMARWFVTAEDADGNLSRFPPFLDTEGADQSAEYLGTVVVDPDIDTELPLMHWYTDDERNSRTRTGARASVFYAGEFYDNIFVRQRGGATNGQSQKFVFNKAYPIYVNDDLPSVSELNLNAQGGDATFLRQPLAFEAYRWGGAPSCLSFLTLMILNGDDDRTGVLIEQVDDDFLARNGLDPLGDLYKLVQRSNLNPVFADVTTGVEKKTGDVGDLASLQTLVDGLSLEGAARKAYLMDSLNLPQIMNYMAIRSINQDADDVRKNFYIYQDSLGTGEWTMFPWDKDWTYGITGDGGQFLKHPFFADEAHRKDNALQWNRLYDAIFDEAVTRQMYLRRLRTLADSLLATDRFENRLDEMFAQAQGDVPNNAATVVRRFFPERRIDLFETYAAGGREALVPAAQVGSPPIEFGEVVFAPESGDQDHEYIQFLNPNRVAVDISGWTLEGGVKFTFAEGTVIAASNLFNPGLDRLYVSPNVNAFRARSISPTGGEGHFAQGGYSGHLSNLGETLTLKDAAGQVIAETTYEGNPSDVERYLVISEIMYHPADDQPGTEFLEFTNLSAEVTLDLSGLTFTQGIEFTFPGEAQLAPGAYLLLVQDAAAFNSALPIVGSFGATSRLANGGETLKLEDANSNTVLEFRYDDEDNWPAEPDGQGASLELRDLTMRTDLDEAASWGASATAGGSPGLGGEPAPPKNNDHQDQDGDGVVALLEEAFGTSDTDPSAGPNALVILRAAGQFTIEVPSVDESITLTLELSEDLQAWLSSEALFTASAEPGKMIWTSDSLPDDSSFRAIRVRASR
ncbi:MAG: hypothetical protein ACI9DF_003669 [Verrucomicrobiales bacterium]|jgi:hypothetical protein